MKNPQIMTASGLVPAQIYVLASGGLVKRWPLTLDLTSLRLASSGDSCTVVSVASLSVGIGGGDGVTLSMSGGAVAATFSGLVSGAAVYSLSRTVLSDEFGTWDYTQPGDGLENAAGDDMSSVVAQTVINESLAAKSGPDLELVSFPANIPEAFDDHWLKRIKFTMPAAGWEGQGSPLICITEQWLTDNELDWFWDYVESDYRSLRLREHPDTAREIGMIHWDYAAREMRLLTRLYSGGSDEAAYLYFGYDEADSPAETYDVLQDRGCFLNGAKHRYHGNNKSGTITPTRFGDVSGAGMYPVPGVDFTGHSASYISVLGTSASFIAPQDLRIDIRIPNGPVDEAIGGFLNSTGVTGGGLRDLMWTNVESGLRLKLDLGSDESISWLVPAEYYDTQVYLVIVLPEEPTPLNMGTVVAAGLAAKMYPRSDPSAGGPLVLAGTTGWTLATWSGQWGSDWRVGRLYRSATYGPARIGAISTRRGAGVATADYAAEAALWYQGPTPSAVGQGNALLEVGLSINYTLAAEKWVSVEVFSDGTRVRTLSGQEQLPAGEQSIFWDGKNDAGAVLSAGDYTAQILELDTLPEWLGDGVVNTIKVDPTTLDYNTQVPAWRQLWTEWGDMAFVTIGGVPRGILAPGTNERQARSYHFALSDIWRPFVLINEETDDNHHLVAATSTHAFYANRRYSDNEHMILRYALPAGNGSAVAENWSYEDSDILQHEISVSNWPVGLAVHESSDVLAYVVAGSHQVTLRVASTGEPLGTIALAGANRLAFASSGDLYAISGSPSAWTIERIQNIGTTNDVSTLVGGLAARPLDISVDPVTGEVGAMHPYPLVQLRTYHPTTGVLSRTLGQLGGVQDNGANVATDTFDFYSYFESDFVDQRGFLAFDESGRIWMSDAGHRRSMFWSGGLELLDTIYFGTRTYMVDANNTLPYKLYVGWLEFDLDLTKTANESGFCTLARNHRYHGVPQAKSNRGLLQVRLFNDGANDRILAQVSEEGAVHTAGKQIIELFTNGSHPVPIGVTMHNDQWWDESGQQTRHRKVGAQEGGTQDLETRPYLGFSAPGGVPTWGGGAVTHQAPRGAALPDRWQESVLTSGTLYTDSSAGGIDSYQGPRNYKNADGKWIVYKNNRNQDHPQKANDYTGVLCHHLGLVPAGSPGYDQLAMPGVIYRVDDSGASPALRNEQGEYGRFPESDIGSGSMGNRVTVSGGLVAAGAHGEFWFKGQLGHVFLFTADDLSFVCQFGRAARASDVDPWPLPEVAGNTFASQIVTWGGVNYMITSSELSGFGGVPIWRLPSVSNIVRSTQTISLLANE